MPSRPFAVLATACFLASACGSNSATSADAGPNGVADASTSPPVDGDAGTPPADSEELSTSSGCKGVYNPEQLLTLELEIADGDWAALRSDSSNSLYVPALLRCGEHELRVAVRRKRSGMTDKPGLKIDINELVAGQRYFGLRKLSLESGIGEGGSSTSARAILSEYLAWRAMVVSGAMSSRAALVQVAVNGQPLGVYVNVEQVDKTFLQSRLGHDDGWLWKFSGSDRDGLKTNEGTDDPYDDYFCFFAKNGCAMPSAETLAAELPTKLDIPQLLRLGAVNAIIANTDAPILKQNNYIFYDSEMPRVYFAWDLDTVMSDDYHVIDGSVPGGVTFYTEALYSNWRADYVAIVDELAAGALSAEAVGAEIDAIVALAGPALDADPLVDGDAASAGQALRTWYEARMETVADQLAAESGGAAR